MNKDIKIKEEFNYSTHQRVKLLVWLFTHSGHLLGAENFRKRKEDGGRGKYAAERKVTKNEGLF